MDINHAILHAFEVAIVQKMMKHKKRVCTDKDMRDLTLVFGPLIPILKPLVEKHSTDAGYKNFVEEMENSPFDFSVCPCSYHRPDLIKNKKA